MSERLARVIDVSELPHGTADSRALLWWGNLGMMTIEGTMFAMMIATYLYLRTVNLDWPPATVQPPALLWPTINLALLVLSVIPMIAADLAAKRENVATFQFGFAICVLVGIAAAIIRWRNLWYLGFKWSDHAYGSVIWTCIGLHSFHLLAATGETGLLLVYSFIRPLTKKQFLDIRCTAVYWYFVVISWLPFYFMIYVVPWMSRKEAM